MRKVGSLEAVVATATVAVTSTKGGAGKSTTVAHLAMEAARKGFKTLVVDCDEAQTSIHVWAAALREGPAPVVRLGTYDSVAIRMAEAQHEGFDLCIVDTPPGGGRLVSLVANLVQHILVPVRVTTFDLHALRHTVDLLRMTADGSLPRDSQKLNALEKAVLVLNGLPSDAGDDFMEDVYGAIIECGAGDVEIIGNLCERRAYATTLARGVGVTESRRDRDAAAEIEELFANLRERIEAREVEIGKATVKQAAREKLPNTTRARVKRKGRR